MLPSEGHSDQSRTGATCSNRSLVHSGDLLPTAAVRTSQFALGFGGLGLRSATADRNAAYWASWLDALPSIRARSLQIADNLLHALAAPRASGSTAVAAAAQAADHLAAQGCHVPAYWDTPEPAHAHVHDQPGHRLRGWQRHAPRACDQRDAFRHLARLLLYSPPYSRSSHHPLRGVPFLLLSAVCAQRCRSRHESGPAVVCLTRSVTTTQPVRPPGPLPPAPSHLSEPSPRSAAGGWCSGRPQRAPCRHEPPTPAPDARRIEIVCNGLPLWHGAQLAVDTTCVSCHWLRRAAARARPRR